MVLYEKERDECIDASVDGSLAIQIQRNRNHQLRQGKDGKRRGGVGEPV